jgi:hypothetical protein
MFVGRTFTCSGCGELSDLLVGDGGAEAVAPGIYRLAIHAIALCPEA